MTDSLVLYEPHPPAVLLTMNRPDKRNALNGPLIAALTDAFKRANEDTAARCVLLTGAGPAFCAGMDLSELEKLVQKPRDPSAVWDEALRLAQLYDLIFALPKPTVAVVNGAAVAGGAGLVTVCDLALCVPEARFGYPEVRRGLVAAMVMPHLLRHVGERLARYLLLAGELITAAEAQQSGLVNAVVPADQLLERALAWAKAIAQGGPQALAQTKVFLRQFARQGMSIEETAQGSAAPRLGEECRLGLHAFFTKQPPPWA